METIKDPWLPAVVGRGGMTRRNTEDAQGSETTLFRPQWWIYVSNLS